MTNLEPLLQNLNSLTPLAVGLVVASGVRGRLQPQVQGTKRENRVIQSGSVALSAEVAPNERWGLFGDSL